MKISDLSSERMLVLEAMKSQLLIVLVNRLGGAVEIPVAEIDGTGGFNMMMSVDPATRSFTFKVVTK